MSEFDPYQTLAVQPSATLAEIKHAYRQLVKQFHPDSRHALAHHDRIAQVNAAYALLKDTRRRQAYDDRRQWNTAITQNTPHARTQRTQQTQAQYREDRQARQAADAHLQEWVHRVYIPVCRELHHIVAQLQAEMTALSADPYDDDLMDDFLAYLEACQVGISKAQGVFRSMPNPTSVAGVAAQLYYALNHLEDGLAELNWFTQSYEDSYLAAGMEMFRKSASLQREAQVLLKGVTAVPMPR